MINSWAVRTTPSNLGGELQEAYSSSLPVFPSKAMMKLAAVAVLSALTALWQILFWYVRRCQKMSEVTRTCFDFQIA